MLVDVHNVSIFGGNKVGDRCYNPRLILTVDKYSNLFHVCKIKQKIKRDTLLFDRNKNSIIFLTEKKTINLVTIYSGCGAVRLAYTAGGRVVAGSNPVIPT